MSFTPKSWADRPSALDPLPGETPAEWLSRIASYDAANPGTLTPVDAAALVDLETRVSDYTDDEINALAASVASSLALKADLASPAFTGSPTVPTAAPGDNTTKAASTAFVTDAVATGGGGGGADVVCRITHSTNQGIPNTTSTFLDYDTDVEDTDGMHFTSSANLTGTVAKTTASDQLVGTGTSFTTELSVGQVISVPGGAVEKRVVIAIADNTHLTVGEDFANNATGQTAKRVNGAIVIRTPGVYVFSMFNRFSASSTGLREANVYRNDSAIREIFANANAVGAGDPTSFGLTLPPTRCVEWEFFEVKVFQDSTGSLDIQGGLPYSPVFACYKVAD